jgi:hypothetical protein
VTLAPSLTSPAALFRKLERESYRTYHSRSRVHKADHFFNFCVTAHAMRDYVLERLGKIQARDKEPFHAQWNTEPLLVAVRDIANSSKHFELRDRTSGQRKAAATMRVRHRKSKFIEVYTNGEGRFDLVATEGQDISVKLSDGTTLPLHEFTHGIMNYWRDYLRQHGIKVRRQPLSQLIGSVA